MPEYQTIKGKGFERDVKIETDAERQEREKREWRAGFDLKSWVEKIEAQLADITTKLTK